MNQWMKKVHLERLIRRLKRYDMFLITSLEKGWLFGLILLDLTIFKESCKIKTETFNIFVGYKWICLLFCKMMISQQDWWATLFCL